MEAWCLTGKRWDNVRTAIEGRCEYEDSSELVSRLRLIKSDAELEYVRTAAALADDALAEAQRLAKAGSPEQDVLAGMKSAIFRGGGDYPASRFIIGSGENALMVRNFTGYGTLGTHDQLQLEFGGAYRHYHSCLMRTILTGEPTGYSLPCTPRGATPFKPARTLPGQVSLSAISSPPLLTPWISPVLGNTDSTPAAIAWGHCIRQHGWTGP